MTLRERAAHVLREPLLHFLIAGALVYAVLSGRPSDPGEQRIVVNEEVVGRLAGRWGETFRRAPTPQELDGLIREYVKDQVYYREALRLGLDRNDEVVVRRLRNKMQALATSDTEASEPSDADLQKLLDADPARYAGDATFTFTHVYLGADTPATRGAAASALAALQQGSSPDDFRQPVPIPASYSASPASDLVGVFGDDFPAALRKIPAGRWSGPVASGIGLHLVRVDRIESGAAPGLADVRQRLVNDWRAAASRTAEADAYRKILAGYDVVIERPR